MPSPTGWSWKGVWRGHCSWQPGAGGGWSLQVQHAQKEGRWEDVKGTIFPLPNPGQWAPELQEGGVGLQQGSLQEWEPALADI